MKALKTKHVMTKCFCCGEEVRAKDAYCDYCGSRNAAVKNSALAKKEVLTKPLWFPKH